MRASRWSSVAAVAAAFALAACGSSAGTPTIAGTSPSNGAGTTSQAAAPTSTAGSVPSSSTAPAASSAVQSSAQQASGGQSSDAGSTEQSSDAGTTTIGAGGLDAQSLNWANTLCVGMAPMANMATAMTSINPNDPKGTQKSLVTMYNQIGDAFIATAAKLQSTPPPTFDKGQEIATKLETALAAAGPAMKQAASQLAAANVTDMASLGAAIQSSSAAMETTLNGLDIGNYELDPKAEAAMEALPACQALSAAVPTSGG